jgi:eukaryotic-like serine/threonine-protein kinase
VSLHELRFEIAFMRGDTAAMGRETSWGLRTPGVQDAFMDALADVEATAGRIGKAREFCQRAVDLAVRNGSNENAAEYLLHDALREAEVGDAQEAVKQADAALALATNQVTRYLSALAFARAGKEARAVTMANQLDRDYPLYAKVQNYWLPSIRAAVQMNHGDAAGAVRSLQVAIPYELGAPRPFVSLYPLYLRGLALLMAHQGPAAAAEFQKLMDHRTLTTFVTPRLSKLQLARAYAMSQDISKAKATYQAFFSLWSDADPGLPIVKQAKAEYGKLQ